jgi:hypothetical protein
MSPECRIRVFCLFILPALAALSLTFTVLVSPAVPEVAAINVLAFLLWLFVGALVCASAARGEVIILHAGLLSLALLPLLMFAWSSLLAEKFVHDWSVGLAIVISHAQCVGAFFVLSHAGYQSRD